MFKKILLVFLLIVTVLAQINSTPSIDSSIRATPTSLTARPPTISVGGSSTGTNSPSGNDVDIDVG